MWLLNVLFAAEWYRYSLYCILHHLIVHYWILLCSAVFCVSMEKHALSLHSTQFEISFWNGLLRPKSFPQIAILIQIQSISSFIAVNSTAAMNSHFFCMIFYEALQTSKCVTGCWTCILCCTGKSSCIVVLSRRAMIVECTDKNELVGCHRKKSNLKVLVEVPPSSKDGLVGHSREFTTNGIDATWREQWPLQCCQTQGRRVDWILSVAVPYRGRVLLMLLEMDSFEIPVGIRRHQRNVGCSQESR